MLEVSNKDDDEDCSDGTGGVVFAAEGLGIKHQSISLKIVNNNSSNIILGMGLPDIIKGHNYKLSEDEHHGLFGISSSGYTVVHNNPEQEDASRAFEFYNGDVVHIESDAKTRKVVFSKTGTTEKFTLDIPESFELIKMKFAVALYEKDSVSIATE